MTKEQAIKNNEQSVDNHKLPTRYFKTSYATSCKKALSIDINILGEFISREFVKQEIHKRNPSGDLVIGRTIEITKREFTKLCDILDNDYTIMN